METVRDINDPLFVSEIDSSQSVVLGAAAYAPILILLNRNCWTEAQPSVLTSPSNDHDAVKV